MLINKFCYVEKEDIELESKGNVETNKNCDGCMYLDFCKQEVNIKDETKTTKETKTVDVNSEEKEVADKPVKEKVVKEKVVKEKVVKEKVVKEKSNKKKKKTLDELAEEDIF